MAEALKITMGELRTIIAGRFSVMADRVSPLPGNLAQQFQEPLSFLRDNLFRDLDAVRVLIDQLHLEGEPEAVVVEQPMTRAEFSEFYNRFIRPSSLFTDAENAAAVQEVFTERGV